jgi:putative ABC transport system permease protein
VSLTERWLKLLLRCYPAAVRRAHGDEIVAFVAAERSHPRFATPLLGALRFWFWASADIVRAGIRARRHDAARRRAGGGRGGTSDGGPRRLPTGSRLLPWLEAAVRAVHHAARSLRRSPGFSVAAVVTMALGIGAAGAAFSIINAVLLKPLPDYEDPERIVYLFATGLDSDNFERWEGEFDAFSAMAVHGLVDAYLRGPEGESWRISVMPASGEFFPIMGIPAAAGRVLVPNDDTSGGAPVAVLTDRMARRRFGDAAAAVGQLVTLDDRGYEVVGVLPKGFRYDVYSYVDVWVPATQWPERSRRVVARLRDGVARDEALAEVTVLARRIEYPEEPGRVGISTLPERVVIFQQRALRVLAGVVGLMLLIACANVVNLLLARNAARRSELAVRAALGAGRGRLAAQVFLEVALLCAAAGMLAWLPAGWMTTALMAAQPNQLPRADGVVMDGSVALFTGLVAALCAAACGAVPALALPLSREDLGRAASAREVGGRLRRALVVAEVAVASLLLVGTALLLRTYLILLPARPGFEWSDRLAFRVELSEKLYGEGERQRVFFDDLVQRLEDLPDVEQVALTSDLPMTRTSETVAVVPPAAGEEDEQMVHPRSVTPGYLELMGMPVLRGRTLQPADGSASPTPVVVNENMARFFWGGGEPLGRRFRMPVTEERSADLVVVGIVADAWNSPGRAESRPEVFLPFGREPRSAAAVVLRTRSPASVAPAALAAVRAIDPGVAVIGPNRRYDTPRMMADVLSDAIAPWRYQLALAAVFALAAVLLTAVGLYGVLAFSVGLRRHEIGVRMALGAAPGAVMRLILGQGMKQVGAGLIIGVLAALAASRVLESFLYGISALDPASYAVCAAFIVAVGTLACWSPARRAARVDPVRSLRGE